MQICGDHWQRLRDALTERGLGDLVSPNGDELKFKIEAGGFDPLFDAHLAIIENLVRWIGPGLLALPGCPICFGNEQHAEKCVDPDCDDPKSPTYFDSFITHAADDEVENWRRYQEAAAAATAEGPDAP